MEFHFATGLFFVSRGKQLPAQSYVRPAKSVASTRLFDKEIGRCKDWDHDMISPWGHQGTGLCLYQYLSVQILITYYLLIVCIGVFVAEMVNIKSTMVSLCEEEMIQLQVTWYTVSAL